MLGKQIQPVFLSQKKFPFPSRMVDVDGETVWIGIADPDSCILSYGVIGKVRNPYPAPEIFPTEKYPVLRPSFLELPASVGLGGLGYVHGAVAEDFGGVGGGFDELTDLYLGRPTSSGAFYFKAVTYTPGAPDVNWVSVALEGIQGVTNKTGIGATVLIEAGGLTKIQQVDGGSMRGSQSSSNLKFGLGEYSGPVTATITWPGGFVQDDIPLVINQLNTISNAAVAVEDSTVTATYSVNSSGLADWVFTWETDGPSDQSLDSVHFDFSSIPAQCQPTVQIITETTSDVSLTYSANPGGGYTHVMTWENRTCVPKCTLPFQVESGWPGETDFSDGSHDLNVRICLGL